MAQIGGARGGEDASMSENEQLEPALATLVAEIEAEHAATQLAAQSALEHAIRCGELLLEAKVKVGHGDWLPWLKANCSFRPRTARAYMQLARAMPTLPEAKWQRVANLSVRDAIAQLGQQARQLARLPAATAEAVLNQAADNKLRDELMHASNAARPMALEEPEWTTVELPWSLPPPDVDLGKRLFAVIEASGLDPLTVQETLNAVYCEHQNLYQLRSPSGMPSEPSGLFLEAAE
jgi:hypothetical protein